MADWRACFPRALCANVRKWAPSGCGAVRTAPLTDADFVHFQGLQELNMSWCLSVTNAAFAHLAGLRALDMSRCNQAAITAKALAPLRGALERLSLWGCDQPGLTDAALAHVGGTLRVLNIGECRQLTDAAFAHLRGLHTLLMWDCNQAAVSDAAFERLGAARLRVLSLEACDQEGVTGAALARLRAGARVYMHGCAPGAVRTARECALDVRVAACRNYAPFGCEPWPEGAGEGEEAALEGGEEGEAAEEGA